MPETYSQGNIPYWTNTERILEAKILNAVNGAGGGTGGGGSVFRGVAANPNGVVTSPSAGAIYYTTTTGAVWQFNGTAGTNTGWVNIISA